jgi:hypothetical protein
MRQRIAGSCHQHRQVGRAIVILAFFILPACSGSDDPPILPPASDEPGTISLERWSWSRASLPADTASGGEGTRSFAANSRVETIRWFLLNPPVLRGYLEPDVGPTDGQTAIPALELYLRSETGTWDASSWGGIMCSATDTGAGFPDISGMAWLDLWVNDWAIDPAERSGRLHVDFGRLDEDGFWPQAGNGDLVTGHFEQEDGILSGAPDGVFTWEEDIGLDGCGLYGDPWACQYDAGREIAGDSPYPQINMTARNGREDSEDIDRNGQWDRANSYFTCIIDLATTEALVDVARDYDNIPDLIAASLAWRLYRIPIRRSVAAVNTDGAPSLSDVRHFRVWFEDASPDGAPIRRMQLAGIRFH